VRHSGLRSAAARSFHTGGWNVTVDRLVVVAEGGDAGSNPLLDLW